MSKLQSKFFLFLILALLAISSCGRRPKNVLTPAQMQDILVHTHMLDGVFASGNFRYYTQEEKAQYYNSILAERNITQAQYDSSLVWYTANPEQFEKIYNQVTDQLAKKEKEIKAAIALGSDRTNLTFASNDLWQTSRAFTFNKYTPNDSLRFVIKDTTLMPDDLYVLQFEYQIASKDSCWDNQMKFRVHYKDGRVDSVRQDIFADSCLHRFTLRRWAGRDVGVDSLSGTLIDIDSCSFNQKVIVKDISLMREYNPRNQDSIQTRLQFLETWKTINDSIYTNSLKNFRIVP